MIGDGALIVAVLMAAEILKRGGTMPEWLQDSKYHIGAGFVGIIFGVVWLKFDRPQQWADRYHHAVIAPLLLYLVITLLPVIFTNGNKNEKFATVFFVVLWVVLVFYDGAWFSLRRSRLSQRQYCGLGKALDHIKHLKSFYWR